MGYIIDSGQYLFDKTLYGIWIALKLLIKLIAYLPLWFIGYMITANILEKTDSAIAWIGLIVIFSLLLYQLVFFTKGIIIGLMNEGNWFWIPMFILCFTITCLYPGWIVFNSIHPYLLKLSPKSANNFFLDSVHFFWDICLLPISIFDKCCSRSGGTIVQTGNLHCVQIIEC